MERLFDYDPLTGIKQTFVHDENASKNEFAVHTEQDAEPIIESNRRAFNDSTVKVGKETMVRVASIPLTVYMDLRKKGIAQDPAAMKRWLNNPDNRFFRTRPGVV